jgi:hypothetical protein
MARIRLPAVPSAAGAQASEHAPTEPPRVLRLWGDEPHHGTRTLPRTGLVTNMQPFSCA